MAYKLDNAHSNIDFTVKHMMISKVRGQFTEFEGTFSLDAQDPKRSSVEVKIKADSINTRMGQRDAHLKSPDFLDAENYPYLTFKSTAVELTSPNTAVLRGDLTIRGVTKPVSVDVEYVGSSKSPWGQEAHGFNGRAVINRKEWGLVWNVGLETGGVLVGDEITVDIELELVKEAETEAVAAD